MMEPRIVICPGCGRKLRFRIARTHVECPQCHTTFPVGVEEEPKEAIYQQSVAPAKPQPAPVLEPAQPSHDPEDYLRRRTTMLLAGGGIAIGCLGVLVAFVAIGVAVLIVSRDGDEQPVAIDEVVEVQHADVVKQDNLNDVGVPNESLPNAPVVVRPPAKSNDTDVSGAPEPTTSQAPPVDDEPPVPATKESTDSTPDPKDETQPDSVTPKSPAKEAEIPKSTSEPTGTPAKPIAPSNVARLAYGWKRGDEHVYQIEINAELEDSIGAVLASCSYTVWDPIKKVKAKEQKNSGTGFVVSSDGYLVTCAHVIEDAKQIDVSIGGQQYPAEVIDTDLGQDLALLRISARELPVLSLANSDEVQLAQEVRAVGFPFSDVLGTQVKINIGSVAGIVQEENGKRFQIDAAINPGNSGGPIINTRGEVVGVASSKMMGIEVSRVGFAVPSDEVGKLLHRNKIDIADPASKQAQPLEGPVLAKLVGPSVALLEVVIDASPRDQHRVTFSGSYTTSVQEKDPGVIRLPSGFPSSTIERGSMNVSPTGDISEYDGEKQLPFVLGPIGKLMIEDIDNRGQRRWGSESQTQLHLIEQTDNSPFGRMPFGPRIRSPFGRGLDPFSRGLDPFGRSEPKQKVTKSYPAVERIRYQLITASDDEALIEKTYEFRTLESRTEPYMVIQGTGEIVFDRKVGMPKKFEYSATLQKHVDGESTRIPLTLTAVLRDPKEVAEQRRKSREAMEQLKKQREEEATVPNPERVAGLLQKIKDSEGIRSASPLLELQRIAIDSEQQEEVAALLAERTESENQIERESAIKALCKWGTEKQEAQFISLLQSSETIVGHSTKSEIMKALAIFRTPEAIRAIASRLEVRNEQHYAKEALVKLGSEAEEIVLEHLKSADESTRRAVADVLKEIGTTKSLEPLNESVKEEKKASAKYSIEKAIKEIEKRE